MYNKFSFIPEKKSNLCILRVSGYLEGNGGSELKAHVVKCLDDDITLFVLDFRAIELISSPGVAALLDIVSFIVDDYAGQVAVFGLDPHHLAVLEMSGFFFLAEQAGEEAGAVSILGG